MKGFLGVDLPCPVPGDEIGFDAMKAFFRELGASSPERRHDLVTKALAASAYTAIEACEDAREAGHIVIAVLQSLSSALERGGYGQLEIDWAAIVPASTSKRMH